MRGLTLSRRLAVSSFDRQLRAWRCLLLNFTLPRRLTVSSFGRQLRAWRKLMLS